MGFILLIFNHKKWEQIYAQNCSLLALDEWNSHIAHNHVPIGIFYFTLGIFFEILYIPFMIAMSKPEFFQYSCYKFMFLLGIIDMVGVLVDTICGGIQCILGMHYCANPKLFYIIGAVSITCYLGATMVCVLLAVGRFFEIVFPKLAKILYNHNFMLVWYSIALGYMVYFWFNAPTFFNIVYLAHYLDPFLGIPKFEKNDAFYGDTIQYLVINSVLVAVGCGVPYAALCVIMMFKSKYYTNVSMSKLQRVMLLQSLAICGEMFLVATVYIWNQYFWVPDFMVKIENITWYCMHGDTPIVYLLLNASLRKQFFQMLKNYTKKSGRTMVQYATSIYPARVNPNQPTFLTEQTQTHAS